MLETKIYTPPMNIEGLDYQARRKLSETYMMVISDIIDDFHWTKLYYITHPMSDGMVCADINTTRLPTYKQVLNNWHDFDFKAVMLKASNDMGLKIAPKEALLEDYRRWDSEWFSAFFAAIIICQVSSSISKQEEKRLCTEQELIDYLREAYKRKLEEGTTEEQRNDKIAEELVSEVYDVNSLSGQLEKMKLKLLEVVNNGGNEANLIEAAEAIKNETLETIVKDIGNVLLRAKTDDDFLKPDDYYW